MGGLPDTLRGQLPCAMPFFFPALRMIVSMVEACWLDSVNGVKDNQLVQVNYLALSPEEEVLSNMGGVPNA